MDTVYTWKQQYPQRLQWRVWVHSRQSVVADVWALILAGALGRYCDADSKE